MMTTQPHVARMDEDGAVVVAPAGEFDISTVDILRAACLEALDDADRLVIDLSGTEFLDSLALGAIVGAGRRAREAGGWVRLVAPQPVVRKALRITEIDTVLGLYDTVDQALSHTEGADDAPATA
jgi:anti-anti-sigma factor